MTREEQIKNEAALNYPFTAISVQEKCESEAFIRGAKWADKTTINKAIDILIDMSNDGVLIHIPHHEKFEKEIRKIMET